MLPFGGVEDRFIFSVKTDNAGTSGTNQFTIPTTGSGYLYDIETSDGQTIVGVTGSHTITFPGAGTYTVYISGTFPQIYFNNSGDKLKILSVGNWGIYGIGVFSYANNFYGCTNIPSIGEDVTNFNIITNGTNCFLSCKIAILPSGMTLNSLTAGSGMFAGNLLTSLPTGMNLPLLTNGTNMFGSNNLTTLPSSMTLPNLTNGFYMFFNNNLTTLPSGMNLPLLTNGFYMFRSNGLTTLPTGMNLPLLTNGNTMFFNNNLTTLPSSMTLPNLTDGTNMFRGNGLTDLPAGMTLPSLTNGNSMFLDCTINTTRYSQLLIDMEAGNVNNNVTFHGGNSKYNTAGETAKNALIARGWVITDGGLE